MSTAVVLTVVLLEQGRQSYRRLSPPPAAFCRFLPPVALPSSPRFSTLYPPPTSPFPHLHTRQLLSLLFVHTPSPTPPSILSPRTFFQHSPFSSLDLLCLLLTTRDRFRSAPLLTRSLSFLPPSLPLASDLLSSPPLFYCSFFRTSFRIVNVARCRFPSSAPLSKVRGEARS